MQDFATEQGIALAGATLSALVVVLRFLLTVELRERSQELSRMERALARELW